MKRLLLSLLLTLSLGAQAQVVGELVGRFQMDVKGGDILELRADGSAALSGEETRWAARGNQLQVGTDVMFYALQGDRLVLQMGAVQINWKRIGAGGKSSGPAAGRTSPGVPMAGGNGGGMAAAPPVASGGSTQDAQARQLLTSSAWCSFTYNKISGTSTTRRVVFGANGIMTINGGAETYSSGYGGTMAGQSGTRNSMRWKFENLRLFLDQGTGLGFQDVGLDATRNSNGAVILKADGREYRMCR
jgi:hypothetical protein